MQLFKQKKLIFQAKYDAKQTQMKQTLLPFNQKSWEQKKGYHVFSPRNGVLNGNAYKPAIINSTNNNSFVYNTATSNSNLLFV